MHDLLATLNPEQRAAVTLGHESGLILAGAGSGKTRVLTTRMAWLLQTGQVSPAGILAVTFTNKAAREMLHRISTLIPVNPRGMWIGTFHGLCHRLLRTHARDAGLPELFTILDSADQLAMLKRLMKQLQVDDEKFPPRQVQQFINWHKEGGVRAGEVESFDAFSRRMAEIYLAYEQQCQREGVVDFAELLLRAFELLTRNAFLRSHYQERFRHILVDEFQDTNALQYRWLKTLAGPHSAVFAVGDDDQSIYAFRGARVGNMHDFEQEFKVQRVVRLEQNYRSHGHILDAANALIRGNHNRLGKNLWTDAGAGEKLRLYAAGSDLDEARFVVDEIRALHRDGRALSSMAILYRSNAQSRVLEQTLFQAGIAYRVYGGLRFFERQEIKNALAYLRLIANPDDDGALLRVANVPTRGIGARTLETLQETARVRGCSLWAAACQGGGSGRGASQLAQFVLLIERMRAGSSTLALPELMQQMLEGSGLLGMYQQEKEGQDRLDNLGELVNAATLFEQGDDEASGLSAFLSHAALEAGDHQADAGSDALQLMTVHAAKGLEFDAVFMTGLEEGLFPHDHSANSTEGIEEERRLMYVAITRARQRLYLSYAQTRMLHGQTRYCTPSRFVSEIPEELIQPINLPSPAGAMRAGGYGSGYAGSYGSAYGRSDAGGGSGSATSSSHSSLKMAQRTPISLHGLTIGQQVRHPKFGEGVVLQLLGQGDSAEAQVNFKSAGLKRLALAYAKLEPA